LGLSEIKSRVYPSVFRHWPAEVVLHFGQNPAIPFHFHPSFTPRRSSDEDDTQISVDLGPWRAAEHAGLGAKQGDHLHRGTARPAWTTSFPAFEKSANVKVELIKGGSGDLINRLKAEKGRQAPPMCCSASPPR
jgi:hypothetical protein